VPRGGSSLIPDRCAAAAGVSEGSSVLDVSAGVPHGKYPVYGAPNLRTASGQADEFPYLSESLIVEGSTRRGDP
jgi:hypothetical protein